MIYQFFDKPRFHDVEFYASRESEDHIHQTGHRQRLLRSIHDIGFVLDVDARCSTLTDLGCGNGGLLFELKTRHPQLKTWGYDLCPKAVEYGKQHYGVEIEYLDFTQTQISVGNIVVLAEVLEHLVDPVGLLRRLRASSTKWLVVSCPAFETPQRHYEYHLWAWTPDSFIQMFRDVGYEVEFHGVFPVVGTQYLIARRVHETPLP